MPVRSVIESLLIIQKTLLSWGGEGWRITSSASPFENITHFELNGNNSHKKIWLSALLSQVTILYELILLFCKIIATVFNIIVKFDNQAKCPFAEKPAFAG
jgi:hypothetical protein